MDELFILGVEPIDYFSKKQNKKVVGCIVFVGQTIDHGTKAVANVFISNGKVDDFPIGYNCKVYYNRFGNPCEVALI